MTEIEKALDLFFAYQEEPESTSKHGKVVEYRFDAYNDIKVYEDGHEERYYIGD